jgi:hypothetical protein
MTHSKFRSSAVVRVRAALAVAFMTVAVSCGGSESTISGTAVLTTIDVTLASASVEVGQATTATAVALDQRADPLPGTPVFFSSAPEVAKVDLETGRILGLSPGTAQILATIGGRTGQRTVNVSQPPAIKINEIQSNGDAPGGWVERFNPTPRAVDVSGWKVSSGHPSAAVTLPMGTIIAAKGYLVLEEALFPLGIGAIDGIHVSSRFDVLVDDYFWSTPAATTFGRCPDGLGEIVITDAATKGAPNVCAQRGPK